MVLIGIDPYPYTYIYIYPATLNLADFAGIEKTSGGTVRVCVCAHFVWVCGIKLEKITTYMMLYDVLWCYMMLYDVIFCLMMFLWYYRICLTPSYIIICHLWSLYVIHKHLWGPLAKGPLYEGLWWKDLSMEAFRVYIYNSWYICGISGASRWCQGTSWMVPQHSTWWLPYATTALTSTSCVARPWQRDGRVNG